MDSKGLCVLCGAHAGMMCQRCYECYCSVNCQIADWPKHKLICIPMPTLIPLQPIKGKKPSVSQRLDRSNFLDDLNETNPSLISRADDNISPLRRPYSSNVNDRNMDDNANNQNFKRVDRNRGNSQYSNNRGSQGGGWSRDNNQNKNDRWERQSTKSDTNFNFSSPGFKADYPGLTTPPDHSNSKEIDFTLKLKNKTTYNATAASAISNSNEKQDDTSPVLQNTSLSSNSSKNRCSKKPWKTPYPFPNDQFFPVIVQYISESNPTLIWVTDLSLDDACNKLLKEINKNISPETKECSNLELNVGEVVAAPFESLYYRAVILEEKSPLNEVRVRLIDYGNDFYINVNKLKPPIPLMKNLNAYAFCVRYKGVSVKIGENITIRITGKENNDIFTAEEKEQRAQSTTPNENILKQLAKGTKISLVKIIGSKKAIVLMDNAAIIAQLSNLTSILSGEESPKWNFSTPPKIGDLVVGKTDNNTWERGYLLGSAKEKYVLYCSDIGQVEVINEIKMVPTEHREISTLAFVLEINKPYISEESLREKYFIAGIPLSLKPCGQDLPLICDLYCGHDKLAEVVTNPWSGNFEELGLESWLCVPGVKDSVRITHVESHCEVYICWDKKCNYYSSLFNELGQDGKSTDATSGKIVLAPHNNQYFRCKVLDKADNEISVLDIDSGFSFKVQSDLIRAANDFVKCAPVYTSRVTLLYLNKITPCASSTALSLLQSYVKEKKSFILTFERCENTVELFVDEDMKSSLNKQLIPFLFEHDSNNKNSDFLNHSNHEKDVAVLNENGKDFIQIEDIEIIPIPTKSGIEILVLDDSMLRDGVITCCIFDPVLLKKQETEYVEPIRKYCTDASLPQEYSPRVNEVCFSMFDEDDQWYRAVCLKELKNDEFLLLYLDYGNTTIANKTKIRKMSKEFLYPCMANTCIIDGLSQTVSDELLTKIKGIVYTDALVKVDSIENVDDSYLISIGDVKKLLS